MSELAKYPLNEHLGRSLEEKEVTDSSTNFIWLFRSLNSFMAVLLVLLLFRGILIHTSESVSAPIFQSRWYFIQLTKVCMVLCTKCVQAQSVPCSWLRGGCHFQPNWKEQLFPVLLVYSLLQDTFGKAFFYKGNKNPKQM